MKYDPHRSLIATKGHIFYYKFSFIFIYFLILLKRFMNVNFMKSQVERFRVYQND